MTSFSAAYVAHSKKEAAAKAEREKAVRAAEAVRESAEEAAEASILQQKKQVLDDLFDVEPHTDLDSQKLGRRFCCKDPACVAKAKGIFFVATKGQCPS